VNRKTATIRSAGQAAIERTSLANASNAARLLVHIAVPFDWSMMPAAVRWIDSIAGPQPHHHPGPAAPAGPNGVRRSGRSCHGDQIGEVRSV